MKILNSKYESMWLKKIALKHVTVLIYNQNASDLGLFKHSRQHTTIINIPSTNRPVKRHMKLKSFKTKWAFTRYLGSHYENQPKTSYY